MAKPPEGLDVDAGDERRNLEKDDAYAVFEIPITVKGALSWACLAASHSFVDLRHDGFRPRSDGLNQMLDRAKCKRATAIVERAPERVRRSRGLMRFETTDLPVSKPVVNEGEKLSGDRHTRLVLAAVLGDPLVIGAQLLATAPAVVADGLDRGPPHEG